MRLVGSGAGPYVVCLARRYNHYAALCIRFIHCWQSIDLAEGQIKGPSVEANTSSQLSPSLLSVSAGEGLFESLRGHPALPSTSLTLSFPELQSKTLQDRVVTDTKTASNDCNTCFSARNTAL